jgi:hypothetical protein
MPVGIVASQRLDPVPPEDADHSETAAEAGEWSIKETAGVMRAFVFRLRSALFALGMFY